MEQKRSDVVDRHEKLKLVNYFAVHCMCSYLSVAYGCSAYYEVEDLHFSYWIQDTLMRSSYFTDVEMVKDDT